MNPKGSRIRFLFLLFFTPVALWLLLLLILPHFELLRMSFMKGESGAGMGVTWDNYLAFFHEPIYWTTFVRTALYSVAVTLIVLVVSLPIAFYTTKIAGAEGAGVPADPDPPPLLGERAAPGLRLDDHPPGERGLEQLPALDRSLEGAGGAALQKLISHRPHRAMSPPPLA